MADATVQSEIEVLVLQEGADKYVVVPKEILDSLRLTEAQMGDLGKELAGAAGPVLDADGWTLVGWGRARYEAPSGVRVAAGAGFGLGKIIAMLVVRRDRP
jgi:hypothetical protein